MTELHVVRVFLGPDGAGGNPLGIVRDGAAVPADRRLATAERLGFSETVFIDDLTDGVATIRIFTPGRELPFAGHPTVGTSWFLRSIGMPVATLRCSAGDVATWVADDLTWIRAMASWVHLIDIRQHATAAEVEAIVPGKLGDPGHYDWAWIDEAAGVLRSRYFATDVGIIEDEATGAAAVVMGDRLGRPLTIRQGVGSELSVRPDPAAGTVDVGGRSTLVEVRDLDQ
jgi:predicted PhzF superfamily epimerase YddE/YHI9